MFERLYVSIGSGTIAYLVKSEKGPVDKSKKTAETHRGPSRIINLGIAKDGIYHPLKI